ncbi:MAG: chain length determinant protein EpsF [Sulfuriferula sp.]
MNLIQLLLILKARRRIILLTLFITVITTTIISLIIPKTYMATASVLVDSQSIDPITGLKLSSDLLPGYMATQVDIITSHNVAARVVDNLKIADNPKVKQQFQEHAAGRGTVRDWVAELLLRKLNVHAAHESSVIYISYSGNNSESAAAIANAFVDAYIQTDLDLKTQPAKQTAAWYNTQLKELRDNLEKSQTKLAEYQQAHDIVISGQMDHGIISGGQMDAESARLEALSAQLVAAQALSYDSISKSHNANKDLAEVMNNPAVQDITSQLVKSEAKLSQLGSTEGVNNPEYQSELAEVTKLRQNLAAQTQSVRQSLSTNASVAQQSVGELRAAVEAQKERMLALKTQQDGGAVLMRDVNNAQRIYDTAMQSFGQFNLQSKANQTDISILNPAIAPLNYSSPKILINIIIAVLLGGLLGLGFALMMEMMDSRVRSEDDIIRELNFPVLGVINSVRVNRSRGIWFKRAVIQSSYNNHLIVDNNNLRN